MKKTVKLLSVIVSVCLCFMCVICNLTACGGRENENGNENGNATYVLSDEIIQLTELDSRMLYVSPVPTEKIEWSSSDPSVAIVVDGSVTGVTAGTAKISAKIGEETLSCTVVVKANDVSNVNLSLEKSRIDVMSGSTFEVKAILTQDGKGVDKSVTWTIVDANGEPFDETDGTLVFDYSGNTVLVYTNKVEQYSVKAACGEMTATCTVRVFANTISRLDAPTPVCNGRTVSWAAIKNATGYFYTINGENETFTESPSVNVEDYLDFNGVSTFEVVASVGDSLYYKDSKSASVVMYPECYTTRSGKTSVSWYAADNAKEYEVYVGATKVGNYSTPTKVDVAGYDFENGEVYVKAIRNDNTSKTGNKLNFRSLVKYTAENAEDLIIANLMGQIANDEYGQGFETETVGGVSTGLAWFDSRLREDSETYQNLADKHRGYDGWSMSVKIEKDILVEALDAGYTSFVMPMYVTAEKPVSGDSPFGIKVNYGKAWINGEVNNETGDSSKYCYPPLNAWFEVEVDIQSFVDRYESLFPVEKTKNAMFSFWKGTNRAQDYGFTFYMDEIYLK